jgi:MarR family transcriptional regulator, organic hydroperoxide resistance regulator
MAGGGKTKSSALRRRQTLPTLDYRPEASVGYQLRKTSRLMANLLKARIASEDISVGMWYFLRALWERDGIIQRELTDHVGLMQPTTVAALGSMQRRGLVRMERDKTDRRSIRIFLTKEGRRLKARLLPKVAEINSIVLKDVAEDDVAHFLHVLKRIHANVSAAVRKPSS